MDVLVKNPNGSINHHLTARMIVAKVGGFAEIDRVNVVSELRVRKLAVEACDTIDWEDGMTKTENIEKIIASFRRVVSDGKKVGSIFHIGKSFFDFTVWIAYDEIENLASISSFVQRNMKDGDEAKLYAYQAQARALQQWAKNYAHEVGLNEDVK